MVAFPDVLRKLTLIVSITLVDVQVLNATGWSFGCVQKELRSDEAEVFVH
jgi:hypothetical protein